MSHIHEKRVPQTYGEIEQQGLAFIHTLEQAPMTERAYCELVELLRVSTYTIGMMRHLGGTFEQERH